jgi:hypothetical protein
MLAPLSYLVLFCIGAGCQCKGEMRHFDITVSLDKSFHEQGIVPSVEVDVIGVSFNELQDWQKKSVTAYFSPNDAVRGSSGDFRRPFLLGEGHETETLKMDDKEGEKLWDKWEKQKVMFLVVLSNYPRLDTSNTVADDPRGRIIPLTCEQWEKEKEIRILVRRDGLGVETPWKQKPE